MRFKNENNRKFIRVLKLVNGMGWVVIYLISISLGLALNQ